MATVLFALLFEPHTKPAALIIPLNAQFQILLCLMFSLCIKLCVDLAVWEVCVKIAIPLFLQDLLVFMKGEKRFYSLIRNQLSL